MTGSNGRCAVSPYLCRNCRAAVGELVEWHGYVWLNVGGWLVADARRHCHVCGEAVHFKRSERALAEMGKDDILTMVNALT